MPLSPTKENSVPTAALQSLRLTLSDAQFELKKIQEDHASATRASKLEREKERKKYEASEKELKEEIEELKLIIDDERKKAKDSMSLSEETMHAQHSAEMVKQVKQLTAEWSAKLASAHQEWETKYERETSLLKQSNNALKVEHEKLIEEVKSLHDKQVLQLVGQHRVELDAVRAQLDSVQTAHAAEKTAEARLQEQAKIAHREALLRAESELCYERNTRKQLEREIEEKEAVVRRLKVDLKEAGVELQLTKERNQRELERIEELAAMDVNSLKEENGKKLAALQKQTAEKCKAFEARVAELSVIHKAQIELQTESFNKLLSQLSERPSRPEDQEQIRTLQEKLVARTAELSHLQRELRLCNLEIENKEDTLSRIFRASSTNGVTSKAKKAGQGACQSSQKQVPQGDENNPQNAPQGLATDRYSRLGTAEPTLQSEQASSRPASLKNEIISHSRCKASLQAHLFQNIHIASRTESVHRANRTHGLLATERKGLSSELKFLLVSQNGNV